MASEHVQTPSQCPGTPWSLQITSCGRCPSARSWLCLHLPTPGSDRWRHVRRPAGQQRTENTAKTSEESHTVDLRRITCPLYFRNNSDEHETAVWKYGLMTSHKKHWSLFHINNVVTHNRRYDSNYCTYWSRLLASTCCSTHWAAGRTASPRELFLGNMSLCHYRPGRHLLFASQCADSSQATRTQRQRKN